MADEKDKQPKTGDDKPKRRSRSTASKSKAAEAKGEAKSGTAKTGTRRRQKKDEASKGGARKPAAKATAPKARATAEAKNEPKAKAEPKGDAKDAQKPPARRRGAAKEESKEASRPRRREPHTRPVVRAQAKYVRSSARKARLVMDHVRGKPVSDARALLRHSPRGIARDLERLLASAVANAENNHDLVGDDLYVKEIYADEGPTLRRFRPRAQGRATRIRKRTSHLTVALSTKE
jgi:ribosomal protein L22